MPLNSGRLTGVIAVQGAYYFGSLAGLYYTWYNDYPQTSFHLFDDNGEWLQIDKAGHATSAYFISRIGYESYRWAGLDKKRSALYGSLLSFAYMMNIEILDGFSKGWGFSGGDFIANTSGGLLFLIQQMMWEEQRIGLKFSYHSTKYASYRPDLFGKSVMQNMLKDYNGHSYWLSANISSFLPAGSRFPKWLNLAVGYGAEGMTGAFRNSENLSGNQFTRYRKFYLSADVDLTRIRTKSKTLHSIFVIINFIKIPFPALEFNSLGKVRLHPLYY